MVVVSFKVSIGWMPLLFLVNSFWDALYLSLKGSVRMLPLLPNLEVTWAIPVSGDNDEDGIKGNSWMEELFLEQWGEAWWGWIEFRVLQDLFSYPFVFPPEGLFLQLLFWVSD